MQNSGIFARKSRFRVLQKDNTDQALSGLRITRPSLSQATELELNLLNNVHQISSNQSSLPDPDPDFSGSGPDPDFSGSGQ